MPAAFDLHVTTEDADASAVLRLCDAAGSQIAWPCVRLCEHPASQWEGLFDLRRCVEHYDLFARLCRGWSRQFYGCLAMPGRVALALTLGLLLGLAPLAGWLAAARRLRGQGVTRAGVSVLGLWSPALLLQHLAAAGLYAPLGVGRAWALAFVPASRFVAALLGHAWLKSVGLARTTWRGTGYSDGAASGAAPAAAAEPGPPQA